MAPNSAIWLVAREFRGFLRAAQHREFGPGQQACAVRLQPVQRAGAHQVLQLLAVQRLGIDAIGEVGQRGVGRGCAYRLHRAGAHLLDRRQRVAHGKRAVRLAFDAEVRRDGVDVEEQGAAAECPWQRLLP